MAVRAHRCSAKIVAPIKCSDVTNVTRHRAKARLGKTKALCGKAKAEA